jgi:hypothetical protein
MIFKPLLVVTYMLATPVYAEEQVSVSKQERLRIALDSWIGSPVSNYALRFGPPTSSFEIGLKRAFQWRVTGQTSGLGVPIGNIIVYRSSQTTCLISFVASTKTPTPTLADWTIETWQYQGTC